MAYDEGLALRIRHALADQAGLTEKAMFGGLGFLLDGHMVAAAGSKRSTESGRGPTLSAWTKR